MKRLLALALVAGAVVAGAALAQTGNQPATLVVRLPGDATLTIGGQSMTQRGSERTFVTPELAPGYQYSYQLEARWMEGGKEVKTTRTVEFSPGKTTVVDFLTKERVPAPRVKTETKAPAVVTGKAETKAPGAKDPPTPLAPKTRNFVFTYSGTVTDLKPGETAKIWLPVPKNSAEQTITIMQAPAQHELHDEPQYGNAILFLEEKANQKGEIPFKVTYKVARKEVKTDVKSGATLKPREAPDQVMRFLQPDKKVPISGKPLDLLRENLKDKPLPGDQFAAAKVLYDVVNTHMKYSKEGKGWGQGDSVWACDSKFGNCTDFHSLFISMARGNKIPSKFEMGFPIPPKRGEGVVGGYHCWAWFMPEGKGWVPVDISEANRFPEMREYYFGNLTEDRVQFTTGRDINLVPRQAGPPLNFLIYPYVEVNGQTYPTEKVQRAFSYQDL